MQPYGKTKISNNEPVQKNHSEKIKLIVTDSNRQQNAK